MEFNNRTEVALAYSAGDIGLDDFVALFSAIPETVVVEHDGVNTQLSGEISNLTTYVLYEVIVIFGIAQAENIRIIINSIENGEVA